MYQWFLSAKTNFLIGCNGIVFGFAQTKSDARGVYNTNNISFQEISFIFEMPTGNKLVILSDNKANLAPSLMVTSPLE